MPEHNLIYKAATHDVTYRVYWRGHVDVNPRSGEVESQVSGDEEAGARHQRVTAVLSGAAEQACQRAGWRHSGTESDWRRQNMTYDEIETVMQ